MARALLALFLLFCAPAFVQISEPQTSRYFPYVYENFQRSPKEVWLAWRAVVPDTETKLLLSKLHLPEAYRWALLAESLRWAARGHNFLQTLAMEAQDSKEETAAEIRHSASASSLIAMAASALAEMLSRPSA